MLQVGDSVEDFTLHDQAGEPVSWADYRGRPVVVFFYPKANTPGCTQEACDFRDLKGELDAAGAAVIGISADSVRKQANWTKKHSLSFPLLSDPERVVLGNGSDEVINLLLTALSGGPESGHLVIPAPTFVMYAHVATVLGVEVREVPLLDSLELDAAAMRAALPGAAVCFLARPNNPTSSLWPATLIRELVAEFPDTVFVIDEAYAAYDPGCSTATDERG